MLGKCGRGISKGTGEGGRGRGEGERGGGEEGKKREE